MDEALSVVGALSMAVVAETVGTAVEAVRRRGDSLTDGMVDIGGPTLDYLTLHCIRFDGTSRQISGHPQRSNMNAPEVVEYIAEGALKQLSREATQLLEESESLLHKGEIAELETQKHVLEQKQSLHKNEIAQLEKEKAEAKLQERRDALQEHIDNIKFLDEKRRAPIQKRIDELKKKAADVKAEDILRIKNGKKRLERIHKQIKDSLQKANLLTRDAYIFRDQGVMVIHIGHTEFHLVDYGKVDTDTHQLAIFGFITELPEPIEIGGGRKMEFALFDPLDTRPIEEGGMVSTTYLTPDDRITMYSWTRRLIRFTSYIREKQKNVTLTKERDALKSVVKDLQESLAAVTEAYEALKGKPGGGAGVSFSSTMLSMLVSHFIFGAIGLGLGVLLSVWFGYTTSVIQEPVLNQTFPHNQIGVANVPVPQINPAVYVTSGISVFVFLLISYAYNSRRWKGR